MLLIFLLILNITICVRSASIVNGRYKPLEPELGEIPYQASLMIMSNKSILTYCGGSLIHLQWVLTAAHCLEHNGQMLPVNRIVIGLGSIYTNGKNAQMIKCDNVSIHEDYFKSGGKTDIGLIKLTKPAILGPAVEIIKLHTSINENLLSKTVYLTGFGIINDMREQPIRLRKAILHVNTPDKCRLNADDGHNAICCTSTIAEGKACKGDSGSPLTIMKNGKYYQIGIASRLSFLPVCRIAFNNSVYTKVSAYIAWISKITGIDFFK